MENSWDSHREILVERLTFAKFIVFILQVYLNRKDSTKEKKSGWVTKLQQAEGHKIY